MPVERDNAPTKYVNDREFDGHIILTDLMAPKPIASKCQRMWMASPEDVANPYFKTNERVIAGTLIMGRSKINLFS